MSSSSRRQFIKGVAAFGIAGLAAPHIARAAAPFSQPKLPYEEGDLSPVISGRTVGLHYGKHHAGYFRNVNKMVKGTDYADMTLEEVVTRSKAEDPKLFNQAGQAWNHILYWEQFSPDGAKAPSKAMAGKIKEAFKDYDDFKAQLIKTSTGVFGSGWGWLVQEEDGSLGLMATSNGDNPLAHGKIALIGIDVWEHAYYLDYENKRGAHVDAVVSNLLNWSVIEGRMKG